MDTCVHEGHLVFTEKVGSEGNIMRKKVRLVIKGFTEVWGPTLGHNTLFSSLAYAASLDLEIHQMDAVAAYLNSNLTEEIYLRPLDGVPVSPHMVWHLKKALYRLKQARLEWYCTLWMHIKSLGYAQSAYDPCLYVQGPECFILVYVDDFIIVDSRGNLEETKWRLAEKYEMRDLGEAQWFLTMEITNDWVA